MYVVQFFRPIHQKLFRLLVADRSPLGWIGCQPVEAPYVTIGQIAPVGFFYYFAVTITLCECKAELFVKRYDTWKGADYDFFQYIGLPLLVLLTIASALELPASATALSVESVP